VCAHTWLPDTFQHFPVVDITSTAHIPLARTLHPLLWFRFLSLVDRYYRYTNRFGHSPEGNPSGGNLYRGLYNITLKVRMTIQASHIAAAPPPGTAVVAGFLATDSGIQRGKTGCARLPP